MGNGPSFFQQRDLKNVGFLKREMQGHGVFAGYVQKAKGKLGTEGESP
jgi:hypothetical protein